MKSILKNKSLTIIMLVLGLLTLVGGNLYLLTSNERLVGAAQTDTSILSVEKVLREVTSFDEGYVYTEPDLTEGLYTTLDIVNNNDFAMLNNSYVDQALLLDPTPENTVFVENLVISFYDTLGLNLSWLTATAWLNGIAIDTSSARITDPVTQRYSFFHSLDLKTLMDNEGNPFSSLEGHYEYKFKYRFTNGVDVSEEMTKTIDFWLIDENNYINTAEQPNIVPKMYNTEKIDRMEYEDYIEQNFFNFNNFNTTDSYVDATSDLDFPTLVYDASRYNISYTKNLYGVSSIITSDFKIIEGVGQVSFYLNDSSTAFKTQNVQVQTTGGLDYYIYDGLKITDVGDYDFTISYAYKTSNTEFRVAQNEGVYNARILSTGDPIVDRASNLRDNNVKLSVFGYQVYYSQGNTGDAEFKSADNSIVSDYTNSATVTASDPEETFAQNYIDAYNLNTENFTFPRVPSNLTIPVLASQVASTNQAPVFLKNYGSLKYNSTFTTSRSFYFFYPTGTKTGTPQIFSYTNNTRFTQNGYYEVVVIYDFEKYQYFDSIIYEGNKSLHMQVFAFKIANLPPAVNITTNTGATITSGKYTNAASVSAAWNSGSIFDVNPTAKIWRQSFNGFNPYTQATQFNQTATYTISGAVYEKNQAITQNGHYTLQVFYGPSTNTSVIYKFTIDQNNVTGFEVVGAKKTISELGNIVYQKDLDLNLTNNLIVNTPFALNWNEKLSGAKISAKYSFTSISKKSSFTAEELGDTNWVTNGYETLNTFSNLTYSKTTTTGDILNANSVLTNASIYIFTLTDEAGNVYTYYVVLDNTKAEIIQTPPPVSKYNFVPEQTTLTWGTHKAIEITNPTGLSSITTANPLFEEYNGTLYLLVPINQVKVYAANLDESDKLDTSVESLLEQQRILTFTKDVNFDSSVTFYTGLEPDIPAGSEAVTGEKIYRTYVTDVSSTTKTTNLSYNNTTMLELQVNLDRSQGYAEMNGTVKSDPDSNYTVLQLNRASNRKYLYFNYKDASDDYKIDSLTYTFYPLTFDLSSPNYPFASVASLINIDILTNAQLIEGELYRTLAINTIFSNKYQTEVTVPGMYVITRTYEGNISEEETGDTKVRQYAYYIDRYDIIEQVDDLLIGENIELSLGEVEGRDEEVFKNFLVITTKPTVLETNLLPVVIQIPQNKYSIYDGALTYSDGIDSFDLEVSLTRNFTNFYGNWETETIATLEIINGLIILPDLYKDGRYDVLIKDKAGYGKTLIGSNQFSFSFEIKSTRPSGAFYGTPYNQQEIELVNVSSTNETTLKFIWTDPEDIYSAKIDSDNVEIKQQLKNSTTQTTIFKVVNGVSIVNTYQLSITENNIGTLIGSNGEDVRKKYILPIFTPESNLSQVEATYYVTIQYEGMESHYVYDDNNFFRNTLSITIDRTAPEYNLNRLINSDIYLSTAQKSTLLDNTSEINSENYPFAINSLFTFKTAPTAFPNQDTYTIYYRQYNKYAAGQANLQSLIPGDENYDNYQVEPFRPRFNSSNTAYKRINYSLSTFASQAIASNGSYYEIIEIDEAGNHRIYTVQFLSSNLAMPAISGIIINANTVEGEYEIFTKSPNNQTQIDALNIQINSVVSSDLWYNLTVKNNVTNATTTLKHTPSTNEVNFVDSLNTLISQTSSIGASYQINLYNRINRNINFTYNAQGNVLEPTFTDYQNSFVITLPTDTQSTQILSFKVYRAINGLIDETEDYRITDDMNGLIINSAGISGASYELEAGQYIFRFVDNFNRSYSPIKIFGFEDVADILYAGTTVTIEDMTYTASDVKIVFQSQLYGVVVTKNDSPYLNIVKNTNSQTGITEMWLNNLANERGLFDEYCITITNSSGNPSYYYFTIYTISPILSLTDSLDNNLNGILGSSYENIGSGTTKPVYISYENTSLFEYDVRLEVTVLDKNNNSSTLVYNEIDPEFAYYRPGIYKLTFYNILNNNVNYYWSIQETQTSIYSVLANINGLEVPLSLANAKYSYQGQEIDQYFTIYSYRPDVNPDRNLTVTRIYPVGTTPAPLGTPEVWQITGTNYAKMFAVTKMPIRTNFLSNNFTINDYLATGYSTKTATNPTILQWAEDNGAVGNYVYVEYYFNSRYVGRLYTNTLTLEDSGMYSFKFKDFAGNTQLFNSQEFYRIILIDKVLFSINNADPIENVIYNQPVSLVVEHLSEYENARNITLSATLNGNAIIPLRVNNAYIFDKYGLYNITIRAQVVLPGEAESQPISSQYTFMIIDENEAKLSFEYSPQTGYEITNIIKDGVNVTDDFKEAYNSNTLTRLFISPTEGGNGNYTITVSANYLTLKPSQTFVFDVWVNNERPVILSSIKEGATTTKNIMLTFNKYLIYQQIGNSVIKINDTQIVTINAETSSVNQITRYEIKNNSTYLVQLQTDMGNTVLSFKVIKKAPLNTVAVFLIIAAVLITTFLTIVFIRLRTKMRVS